MIESHERAQLRDGILGRRDRFAHALADRVDEPAEELQEELLLGVEVVERDALGDAGPARDVVPE
jgi:hypothetical protein